MVRARLPDIVLGKVLSVETLAAWLPIVGILAIFWLLIIRPAQRRQKALRDLQERLAVGDQVITNSGIFGTVTRVEEDRVGLEVAEGVVMTFAMAAIVGVVADRADATEVRNEGEIQNEGQE